MCWVRRGWKLCSWKKTLIVLSHYRDLEKKVRGRFLFVSRYDITLPLYTDAAAMLCCVLYTLSRSNIKTLLLLGWNVQREQQFLGGSSREIITCLLFLKGRNEDVRFISVNNAPCNGWQQPRLFLHQRIPWWLLTTLVQLSEKLIVTDVIVLI